MTTVDEPDFFMMANLGKRNTGLPFVVWISVGADHNQKVCIRVSRELKAIPTEMVSVVIYPDINVVEGELSASDLALLTRWVELNREVLVGYWKGDIEYTADAIAAIRPIQVIETIP